MLGRSPSATAASLILAGSLALSGCSLMPGGDDEPAAPATSAAPEDTSLPATAWDEAKRGDIEPGGSLRLASSALPANFNPLHADGATSTAAEILAPTVGSAVRVTADGQWEVDPDYAESVEVTDTDPLTVEVALNPQAVWQGGTPITGQDMVDFWQAQNGSDSDFEVRSTEGYDDIDDVEVGDDEFTYTVTFDKPLADWPAYVYPRLPSNVSSSPDLFNTAFEERAISSNGPYVTESIDPESGTVTQKPNPRWWGAEPLLADITWRIATPDVQAQAFAGGELDAVELDASTYATARDTGAAQENASIQRAAGSEWTHLTLNSADGPLADGDVRRAVARAIDREAIADQAAQPLGAPAAVLGSQIYLPGQQGYEDSSALIDHDPAEAERLLAEAGFEKDEQGVQVRDGEPLALTMPVPEGAPSITQRAEAIVADLEAVGVQVELRSVPLDTFYTDVVIALDFDLVTFAWTGSPFPFADAEARVFPVDSPQNFTGRGTEKVGDGFDVTAGTLDEAKLVKRVRLVDEMLLDAPSIIPIAATPSVMALREGLVNFGPSLFEQPDWTRVGFAAAPSDD